MPVQSAFVAPLSAEDILRRGADVVRIEADALAALALSLENSFVKACEAIFPRAAES